MEYDVFGLIADLEGLIESGKKVPFTSQFMVDRDAVLHCVQLVRDNLPEALKEANRIIKQESRIVQEAKNHAGNVLAEADAKARSLRMDSEQRATLLVSGAEQTAETTLAEAKRHADELIDAAENKAQELVAQTSITFRAEQQASDTLAKARAEAQRIRMTMYDHVVDLLKRAEDLTIEVANELRDARVQVDQER